MATYWWLDKSEWPKINGAALTGQHGNHSRGADHYAAKVTESDVRNIRSGFYKSDVAAAKELGIHAQTVRRIRRREMWAHVQ